MPNTANRSYPYPARGNQPRFGWRDIQQLAEAVDLDVATQAARIAVLESGTILRQRTILSGAAATVDFAVPATYSRVTVNWTARGSAAFLTRQMLIRINNDATSNYYWMFHDANNGGTSTSIGNPASSISGPYIPAASAGANFFGSGGVDVVGWDSPHSVTLGIRTAGGSFIPATNAYTQSSHGVYNVAGPYTTIRLLPETGNFITGSAFYCDAFRY